MSIYVLVVLLVATLISLAETSLILKYMPSNRHSNRREILIVIGSMILSAAVGVAAGFQVLLI